MSNLSDTLSHFYKNCYNFFESECRTSNLITADETRQRKNYSICFYQKFAVTWFKNATVFEVKKCASAFAVGWLYQH